MKSATDKIPNGPYNFLFYSSKPYKLVAFLALTFVVLASLGGVAVPYIFKRIVDELSGVSGLGPDSISFWATLYVLVSFANAMSYRGSGFAGLRWATGVRATGREMLTDYVTKHGHSFFSNRFAGAVGAKLRTASEGLKSMVEAILWDWLNFILKTVIGFGIVFYTNMYIGFVFTLWVVFIVPVNILFLRKKIPLGIAAQAADTHLTAHTVDVLTNINAMHDYARRPFEITRLNEIIRERRESGMRNWTFGEWMLTINGIFEGIFIGVIIWVTINLLNLGMITAGDVILVLTLTVSIRSDLIHLGGKFNSSADIISQVKEGLSDILHPHEIVDELNAKDIQVSNGEIVFENTTFKYGDKEIFSNLNLRIEAGQRVGLVGRSGAGKSTLMKLMVRQFDVSGGKILIDGQTISGVKQESLRDSVAVVPQEPLLFHRSLKDNIRYGKLSASDDELVESARQALAHDFIDTLPQKYETLVGERGVKLSGGERQRVAIARAFLKNAKILLLDEATSSLDSESEVLISKALEKLMEGKTVIAIAHRLSTLRAMNRILVLDNGKIIEDGSHDELLKQGGVYAELWNHQAGGFIKDH